MATFTSNDEFESSDDADEEIEPRLKYTKLIKLHNILIDDFATSIAVHEKFICLGTNSGIIYVFDHKGEIIARHDALKKAAVNQISIDRKGNFLAVCFINEKFSIYNLSTNMVEHEEFDGMYSAAMDPHLEGCFIIKGTRDLYVYDRTDQGKDSRKKWHKTHVCDTVMFGKTLSCGENFIALSNDYGVYIYNSCAQCFLQVIKWNEHSKPPNKFKSHLRWSNANTLLIACTDTVWVYTISKKCNLVKPSKIDAVSTFRTDFYISGIAALDDQLVLLGFPKESDENQGRPHLYILEYDRNGCTEICVDCLSLHNQLNFDDCHLDVLNNRFYILTPKDVIIASPYELDNRIQWLVEHNKFNVALGLVRKAKENDTTYTVETVGEAYLDHVLSSGAYSTAARLCNDVCGNDKKTWEKVISKFAEAKQLRSVGGYIPSSLERKLEPHIYEMVLNEFLEYDLEGFLNLVKEWDPSLYDVKLVINATLDRVIASNNETVCFEALAVLYAHDQQYDKSARMYLKMKHKDVFKLIRMHDLLPFAESIKDELMNLDRQETIALFLEKNRLSSKLFFGRLVQIPMMTTFFVGPI